MKILFLGGFYPKEYIHQIRNSSKGPIANANNALQWAYIEGFYSHIQSSSDQLYLISLPQIGAYPFRYTKLFFKVSNKYFIKKYNLIGICSNFLNLILFKHISRYFISRKILSDLIRKFDEKENILIILYDLHVPFLKAVKNIKKKYSNLRFCVIIPDLQGLTGSRQDLFHKVFEYFEKKLIDSSYKIIDSYVLLSKYMIEKIPINNKPWIVVEGMYNLKDDISLVPKKTDLKYIFYSGALDKRNGVDNLLNAFVQIKDSSFRLVLCGDGYLRTEIEEAASHDSRIEFKGQIDRQEVLTLQKKATLLVNPRQASGVFTRYSFPSKTIEYFASSKPVLMYKIDGIPDEYYNYCFSPKDNSVVELKNSILEICNLSENILNEIGMRARAFVKEQKNSFVQTEKLLQMTSKLF